MKLLITKHKCTYSIQPKCTYSFQNANVLTQWSCIRCRWTDERHHIFVDRLGRRCSNNETKSNRWWKILRQNTKWLNQIRETEVMMVELNQWDRRQYGRIRSAPLMTKWRNIRDNDYLILLKSKNNICGKASFRSWPEVSNYE